ncbi:hypothetical protein ACLB2K_016891 [Fragaria x ananassa]
MADDHSSFTKDLLPKKSSLLLRTNVVLFVMLCGVYICSVCLKQIRTGTSIRFLSIPEVIQKPCQKPYIEPEEAPYVHFPKPTTYSRAECACNPVRYFAIFSMQRSGSGWFETLLNNHTNISSNGEIFSVKVRRSNMSTISETLDRVYNLDWLSSASKNECTAAVGLKWMLNQGLMQNHGQIVEYFNTRLSFSFEEICCVEILAKYKPTINTTLLLANLKQVEDRTAKALQYFNSTRHIILYYEDVVKNRTKLKDVQDFLKVPQRDLKSHQVKIHKGSLSNQVENWGDVQKALNGTHYESFLHSDLRSGHVPVDFSLGMNVYFDNTDAECVTVVSTANPTETVSTFHKAE